MEIEEGAQLLDLVLHASHPSVLLLSLRLLGAALGNFVLGAHFVEPALGTLLAKVGQVGGIDPFTSQEGTEFSRLVAGVSLGENAEFVGDGELASGGLLDHLGIRCRECAGERCRRMERLGAGVTVVGCGFDDQCVHEDLPSPP